MRIGCGQLTWTNTPPDTVLREIAEAGYDGAPGSLDGERSAAEELSWFAGFGLSPAPPYYSGAFWDPSQRASIMADAPRVAARVRELGCTELYVAAEGSNFLTSSGAPRHAIAGQVTAADALSGDAFATFGEVLGAFAEATAAEGVASCFHNHVGTVIETAWELERLLAHVPGDSLSLGLDTGHLAWAGEDATVVCLRYLDRIRTLHLKDVNDEVRRRGIAGNWEYAQFNAGGIFAELGEGMVDFPAILDPLVQRGFDGWLIVETDVTMKASAAESARISRDYLRTIGF